MGSTERATTRVNRRKGADDDRSRLAAVVESSYDAIIAKTLDGTIVSWNAAAERMYGYSAEEAIGQPITVIVPPDRRDEPARLQQRVQTGERIEQFETVRRTKDGRLIDVALTMSPVRDPEGNVTGISVIARDIGERKRVARTLAFLADAGELLAEEAADYGKALSSLAQLALPLFGDWCAIDLLNEDGTVERTAVAHRDPEKAETARRLQSRYPPYDASRGVARVLRSGQPELAPTTSDHTLAALSGEPEHLDLLRELGVGSFMCLPLVARGRTAGSITFVRTLPGSRYGQDDLTVAREVARRIALAIDNARLYSDLQTAVEAKDEFQGLISHELRTPITSIYGGVRLLQSRGDKLDEATKAGVLDDIERETERLHRIVEDLLALSRLDLGQAVVTEPVLLGRTIEKAVTAFSRRRPSRRVDVSVDESVGPVLAEPTFLEQVLRNLLGNADKYSPTDAAVEVRATPTEDGYVAVSVLDRGSGVAPDEVDQIFDRFFRSKRTSGKAGGLGVGLTACRRLVEAQRGQISARPREGGGLEVCFTLPGYDEGEE